MERISGLDQSGMNAEKARPVKRMHKVEPAGFRTRKKSPIVLIFNCSGAILFSPHFLLKNRLPARCFFPDNRHCSVYLPDYT
jgi:hypothetical protein